jgi:hypothetical protein
MNSTDSTSATSSAESPAGRSPCDGPDSTERRESGPDHAHASHFHAPGKGLEPRTTDTYGRNSSVSSEIADLPLFSGSRLPARTLSERLAERLKANPRLSGSMEFAGIWKERVTPQGRRFWEHSAQERHIAGGGCTGWHTPTVRDLKNSGGDGKNPRCLVRQSALESWPTPRTPTGCPESAEQKKARGSAGGGSDLASTAFLAAWPTPNTMQGGQTSRGWDRKDEKLMGGLIPWATPRAADAESAGMRHSRGVADTLTAQAGQGVTGWATPTANDAEKRGQVAYRDGKPNGLNAQVTLTGWATPKVADGRGNPYDATENRRSELRKQMPSDGPSTTSSPAETGKRGVLNPAHSRWLMGYPVAWCQAAIRASRKLKQRRKRGPCASKDTATPSAHNSPPNSSPQ